MIWSILSVLVCAALIVKLMFFTDQLRRQSNLFYRLVIFASAVYAFDHILMQVYSPHQISPWKTLLHLGLFLGALWIRPEHLDPTYHSTRKTTTNERHL